MLKIIYELAAPMTLAFHSTSIWALFQ